MTTKSNTQDCSLGIEELLQALPDEFNNEYVQDSLTGLIDRITMRKAPISSLSRMWALGSMQAKITFGYLAYAIRSRLVGETEKQRLLNETNLRAAMQLLGTMGYMRGAVMKIGQMLANLPKIMPQEFTDVLGSLHFEAPAMHYSLVREVFLDEMGHEPEEIFASFDKKAFAAASLGQVHQARLETGEEVAVKIQYPNMARMIKSDIRNLLALLLPMRFQKDWSFISDHIKDLEVMLKQEADYEKEANFMQVAWDLFQEDEFIVVPKVYRNLSSNRVLTMEYLPGKHLHQFLATGPDQNLRNHYGNLISRAIIRMSYHSKCFYTDPHPGNFLMMGGGRLGFIDFGCHRQLTEEEWQITNSGEKALMFTHDEALCNEVIAYGCLYDDVEEMDKERVEFVRRMILWQAEPAMKDEPFDFGDEDWFQRGMNLNIELARQRNTRYGPVYNWTNRTLLGHRVLMYMLKCKFNFREIYVENNPFAADLLSKAN